ncbi:hypothetical protein GRJ2_003365900 [Grus japonensis]|uniref:Integrase catalytic domain-containing protein n=1 Tax=Grus japonensis TaxID=30415 RepID=A0ABC9YJA0_GRUJA
MMMNHDHHENRRKRQNQSPIWPVRKSNGEWRLTVDYRGLNEFTLPMSAAMPDMLELQYGVKDIAAWLEKLIVKVRHVDAHVPKSRATEEHQNNQQVDQAAKIEVAQVDLDWQCKGELFIARWAHDASGHQGRDATYRWARDRGVDCIMDAISEVMHDCEACAAIKQAKQVKPLWYGGQWLKYKYGEAWQTDYITLPQTHQGKRYVLTMVEATTGWLETYPVPHAIAQNTLLGLEKQVLWQYDTPERIESDSGTHFRNNLIDTWAKDHGIEWVYHYVIYGYKLFRRDRQGRRGGGVALYVKECFDCLELNDGDNRVECLWVRISGKANKADIMVGVCYRPLNQDEEADKIFYKQLGEVSQSLALVLVGDFNLPDACWKYNTVERKQSRRFLECVEDNFLTQLVSEPTREGAPLDLLFVNREGLMGDVMVGGYLGHSDHKMTEFSVLREIRRRVSKTATLDFQRADFSLFRGLVDRVPWEAVLKGKGEGNLKGAGAGCPHVLKDEPAGKKTGLGEQRALAGTQEKKESLWPLEEGALAVEGHLSEDMDDSQATPEVAPRPKRPMPRVVTTPTKKKRRVIVIGDSLLKGTEGLICRAGPPLREVCCLPRACVKDIARKLPSLVRPSDYYPLLLLHVGGDEAETCTTKAIKRDFRLLGQSLKDSGAQVIFSSLLPVEGSNGGRNRRTQSINAWLCDWCQHHNFGFFDNGAAYTAPGLMNPDGIHLSQRGKRIFAQELGGLIDRALN